MDEKLYLVIVFFGLLLPLLWLKRLINFDWEVFSYEGRNVDIRVNLIFSTILRVVTLME